MFPYTIITIYLFKRSLKVNINCILLIHSIPNYYPNQIKILYLIYYIFKLLKYMSSLIQKMSSYLLHSSFGIYNHYVQCFWAKTKIKFVFKQHHLHQVIVTPISSAQYHNFKYKKIQSIMVTIHGLLYHSRHLIKFKQNKFFPTHHSGMVTIARITQKKYNSRQKINSAYNFNFFYSHKFGKK